MAESRVRDGTLTAFHRTNRKDRDAGHAEMNSLTSLAEETAQQAGELILQWYDNQKSSVSYKSDASPLTEADIASDKHILAALSGTGIPVISEEAECPYSARKDWDSFWLVDPLDGTKDFLARNGEFTVNIALMRAGVPVIGVVYAPAIGVMYSAGEDGRAYYIHKGSRQRLPCISPPAPLTATVSRQHLSETTRKFLEINGIHEYVLKGSSLKFGTVASGEATIYPRFEGSMEWDIAAGHAVLIAAGCPIIDLVTGKPPAYNKPDMHNNPFIACAPGIEIGSLNIP